jgi:hypothetical protein
LVRWPAVVAVIVSLAGLPSAALAATRCVGTSGAGCDAVYATIGNDAAAGSAVQAAASGDTIRIGPGSYPEVSTAKALHFVGAGAGTLDAFDITTQTRIIGASGLAGTPALTLNGGGSVASLRARGGNATSLEQGGRGLVLQAQGAGGALDYSVSDVVAIAGTGVYGAEGLKVSDAGTGRAINAAVTGGAFLADGPLSAVSVTSGTGASSLTGVTVRAPAAIGVGATGGTLRIVGSRVLAANPLWVTGGLSSARVEAIDSVFEAPSGAQSFDAAYVATTGSGNSTLIARGSTFLARGSGTAAGLKLLKSTSFTGALSADLVNTIVRTESTNPDSFDINADSGGTVGADFSSFSTRRNANGGTSPAPGSASNVFGDPMFTSSAAGDLTLQSGSPLIDRGSAGVVVAGELDVAGNPRSLDGNGDCLARPDIGAFERADACPQAPANVSPSISGVSMTNRVFAPEGTQAAKRKPKRGTTFRYTLSEAALVTITIERQLPGRRVRVRGKARCVKPTRRNTHARKCKRYRRAGKLSEQEQAGSQSMHFSGRLRGRPLRPGRYRARIVAVDSLGARSSEPRLAFRVVRP